MRESIWHFNQQLLRRRRGATVLIDIRTLTWKIELFQFIYVCRIFCLLSCWQSSMFKLVFWRIHRAHQLGLGLIPRMFAFPIPNFCRRFYPANKLPARRGWWMWTSIPILPVLSWIIAFAIKLMNVGIGLLNDSHLYCVCSEKLNAYNVQRNCNKPWVPV